MTEYASDRGQIPLAIGIREKPGFDLYLPGTNDEACLAVKRIAEGIEYGNAYLWGQSGTGKSHLLHAACSLAHEQQHKVAYLPLTDSADLSLDILQDLDTLDLICIDDIDQIAGQAEWEQALFHFYNRARDRQSALLITGKVSPQALAIELPDLKSRIGWDLVYHLDTLDDNGKIKVLQQRANARAFDLPDDVAEYLVNRVERDLPNLIQLLDRFDDATLAEKRKLTIPFVKKLLNHN